MCVCEREMRVLMGLSVLLFWGLAWLHWAILLPVSVQWIHISQQYEPAHRSTHNAQSTNTMPVSYSFKMITHNAHTQHYSGVKVCRSPGCLIYTKHSHQPLHLIWSWTPVLWPHALISCCPLFLSLTFSATDTHVFPFNLNSHFFIAFLYIY